MKRLLHGLVLLCGLAAADAVAGCAAAEETVATCRIEGQQKQVSICLYEDESGPMDVAYRYGPVQGKEELVLRVPLMELGYLTASGAGVTVDETAIFASGDHSYRVTFGFRDGRKPDPSALHKFGTVQVLRQGATLAELACAPETIVRTPDLLLERMRERGRTHASDGTTLSNYDIDRPGPLSEAPPCARKNDVDTCWSLGVSAARAGDLALALGYYDKSCDAGFVTYGCYDGGKLYLHNRQLRDYAKAYERLDRSLQGLRSRPGAVCVQVPGLDAPDRHRREKRQRGGLALAVGRLLRPRRGTVDRRRGLRPARQDDPDRASAGRCAGAAQ